MELKLSVYASSAQEASPLPHPVFLRFRDVHVLEGSVQEDGNSEEECVSHILVVLNLEVYFANATVRVCCKLPFSCLTLLESE